MNFSRFPQNGLVPQRHSNSILLSSRVDNLLSPLLAQHPKIRLFYWQTLLFPGLQALDFRPMTPVINNSVVFQQLAVSKKMVFVFPIVAYCHNQIHRNSLTL
jgi:hypothetical protein